jgi:BlaI family transcriptional regulator, penicillinase repressor
MIDSHDARLSRRERQIMDIIFAKGEATGTEIMDALPDELSYSAVRTFLRILEQKGYLKHRKREKRFVYFPTVSHRRASQSATKRLLNTFFAGSVQKAFVALLDASDTKLSEAEVKRIEAMIEKARKDGR